MPLAKSRPSAISNHRFLVSSTIETFLVDAVSNQFLAKMSSQPEKPHGEGVSEAEPSAVTYENPKFEDDSGAVFQEIDQEEERKIIKKIDMVVMPTLAIVYLFQCMMLSHSTPILSWAQMG